MGKITTAVFESGSTTANVYGLWQYDYGQTLRIQGLNLPSAVEIHFSLQETGGTSVSRVGVTKDGVTDVIIPDSMLENDGATRNYDMFAFVYLTDDTSGQTEYKIKLQVKSRPKPEVFGGGENPNIFHEAVQAVQKSADKAAESEKQAEGWARGREDLPERAQDNAKYYAGQTAADAKKTGTDRKEVERLVESVSDIDQQVTKVENLTKQAQTSVTNAALSEQAAKTAETNAQAAQAGAEAAEGNAELAERNAKASEQAVETAKQLVTQMGQEVLNNKNHVDQTVQAFDLTAQQAVTDVNNAGQTQTERVEGAGNDAVESVKTAQGTAAQAVETAKVEAVKAVQTEGTTQTGNVSAEGEKQVQAVRAAAQEIVADREQIQKNKEGIEGLKQGKADAIVETASGEIIQVEDSSGLGFEGLRIFGKSTQDGVPSPESPVSIASAGDKGTVDVGVIGKNLIPFPYRDKSKVINNVTVTIQDDGRLILNGTASGSVSIDLFLGKILLKDGATYVVSKELNIKINNDVIVSTKYIAKKGDYISHIWYWYATGTIFNNVLLSPQVEISSKITSYEPYRTPQTITLSTPNGLPGIKVDSDGNYTDSNGQQWICDEIDLERGKYVQRVRNAVLNSSLGQLSVGVHGNGVHYLGVSLKVRPKMNSLGMCERYKGNERWTDKNGYVYIPSNRSIIITDNRFTDIDSAKRVIDTEQAKLLYIMDTPIEHDLTPEEIAAYKALHTNYPTTVISNDESAHMEVSYVADTKNYIVSKIETPLQKQIIDLQNALISQKISGGV